MQDQVADVGAFFHGLRTPNEAFFHQNPTWTSPLYSSTNISLKKLSLYWGLGFEFGI